MSFRSHRAIVALTLAAAALVGLLGLTGCRGESHAGGEVWYCPMHPDYVADRPGSCPICHMDLVRREAAEKPTLWVCPMHPEVVRHEPGQCPICGMDLVGKSEGADAAADAAPGGFAAVDLDPEGRRISGVVVAAARAGSLARVVRTVGSVVADERRARRLEARFSGWIEALSADFVGRYLRAGETVAEIYSPELVAAQQEFLLAREKGQQFISSSIPEVRRGGQDLVDAARRRLEVFGLPEEFLADLEREGRPRRRVALAAPISGYVVSKGVLQGQMVTPGQEIVTLSDLSSVWVEANVYEADAAKVRPGQTARLSLSYEPDSVREGKVAYIFPDLDPATRTLRVRFDVANRDLSWRPGMYADVVLDLGEVTGILVPDTAVLDTGERQIAFVETAPGRFEPRELAVALRREGQAVVSAGLAPGDRVAVKANFLLDSESRLRAAISGLGARAGRRGAATGADRGPPMISRLIELSAKNRALVLLATAAAIAFSVHILGVIRLDALPDLSDTQVIVYSRWDRSPDILEDQVTYPIVSSMLGAPKVKAVRGFSDFGFSYVYVIFEDGTDLYWARSRVLEYLSKIQPQLPAGVRTELGPDATGVGWVFQYVLRDRSGGTRSTSCGLSRTGRCATRSRRFRASPRWRRSAATASSIQITVDPNRLAAYGLSIAELADAVRRSNDETGGRLIEWSGAESMVRVRGYARSVEEFGAIVVKVGPGGVPVLVRDVARVALGPEIRRGVADFNGEGDHVGGIVVMRHGENAKNVIARVRARLDELEASLPEGVEVVTTYDRSVLIDRAIGTLKHELTIEMIVVSLVILLFLWHLPSAIVPILTIPISVLLAFVPLYYFGVTVNIMSLAGIAISIGVLVDGAIVEVENAYNRIHLWQGRWRGRGELSAAAREERRREFFHVRLEALKEVGPSVFFSLLVIAVAFLPIFALVDQEGRLFKPLAWSKNLAMALAALLAVTLDPAMRMLFARIDPFEFRPRWLARLATGALVGTYHAEEAHPISRAIHRVYEPVCRWVAGVAEDGARRRGARPRALVADVLPAGQRVHAAAQRGLDPLHADHAARPLGRRRAGAARAAGPGARGFPGGRVGARQGRARRDLDRPGAVLDDRDDGGAQTGAGVAGEADLARRLAGVHQAAAAPVLARSHLLGGADRRARPRAAHPGRHQRLDDADQGAHRHAVDRCAHSGRGQGLRPRPRRDRAAGRGDRRDPARRSGHAQRLRRAGGRRLFRGHRAATASGWRVTA